MGNYRQMSLSAVTQLIQKLTKTAVPVLKCLFRRQNSGVPSAAETAVNQNGSRFESGLFSNFFKKNQKFWLEAVAPQTPRD